jgi:CelD/BcsL family acetyltransferase involved in cellulose biosynthesis
LTSDCTTLTVAAEPFEQIEHDWAALAQRLARPLPFHFPDWHRAWWSHYGDGREPIFLAVRDETALAGVVPLMRAGETLSIAGDPQICDYTDLPITVADPAGLLTPVLDAVDLLPWQTFHLWGLPEESAALDAARGWSDARGYEAETDFEAVCPRVTLAPDWETYLSGLSKKDRHELKRKMRRFAEAGADVRLRVLSEPAAMDSALDVFFHLHRISRHDKAQFMTEQMEAFFRQMAVALAGRGIARLYLVEVDARPAAALLGFKSGDELLLYNSGYDPAYASASVGLVSKAMALQSAIDDGLVTLDFLRGAEPYKYDLGGQDRIVRQIWVRRREE